METIAFSYTKALGKEAVEAVAVEAVAAQKPCMPVMVRETIFWVGFICRRR